MKKGLLIGIIAAIAVVGVGVWSYFYWYVNNDDQPTPSASSSDNAGKEMQEFAIRFAVADTNFYGDIEGKNSDDYFAQLCGNNPPEHSRPHIAKNEVLPMLTDEMKDKLKDVSYNYMECEMRNAPILESQTGVLDDKRPVRMLENINKDKYTFSVPLIISTKSFKGGAVSEHDDAGTSVFTDTTYSNEIFADMKVTVVRQDDGKLAVDNFDATDKAWSAINLVK